MKSKYLKVFIFFIFIICFFVKPSNSIGFSKISLSRATITLANLSYKYDGTAKKPAVRVKIGSRTLTQGVDYYLFYSNYTNAGTATVYISANPKSKYCYGSTFKKYIINKKPLIDSDVRISLPRYYYTYTGMKINPVVTINANSKVLKQGTDFNVEYKNSVNVGTYYIKISGINNYCLNKNITYKITPQSINNSIISINDSNCAYNGKSQKPQISISYKNLKLIENRDYNIIYKNNINHSTNKAQAIILGTGNYSGQITKNFSIKSTTKEIVDYSKTFIGTPYVYGGSTKNGFDCAGFTQYVFDYFGYSLPHAAKQQMNLNYGTKITSTSSLKIGDLVFFRTSSYHVGIYVGSGKFIHSPSPGRTVCITSFFDDQKDGDYYGNRFICGRRILD